MKFMDKDDFEKQNVFGTGQANTAYAKYFIGDSFLNPLTDPKCGLFLANVTFEPGCRNNWHIHHATKGGGQMLICTAGEGWYKDAINASIMDIACDLAVGRLLNAHDAPFETFVEADDPDDPDSGTHYKEEYQKEYDTYYDKEYARVAKLMKFDYCQDDGVAASPEDTNT